MFLRAGSGGGTAEGAEEESEILLWMCFVEEEVGSLASPATPQQLPDFVTGMTKLPLPRQCGKWWWHVQIFILSWPLHLVASQETLRPQWLLFVNAAPYFVTQTLRWVFSACFHEQHNVPGRLLRNCSSEPNSATALEMGKSSKAKRAMFVSIREELALNIDRNSLPCSPELTTPLMSTRSLCLSSLVYRKDFKWL